MDGKVKIEKIRSVNDGAERGVKLIEDFNQLLTKNEDDMQFLLQAVCEYRKKYPSHTKSTLALSMYK